MNKLLFFYSVILLLCGLFVLPGHSKAAAIKNFVFTYKDESFTATSTASWQGYSILSTSSAEPQPGQTLTKSLKEFVGLPAASQAMQGKAFNYRLSAFYDFLEGVGQQLKVPTQEPALIIDNSRAIEFTPPRTGLSLDVYKSSLNALRSMEIGRNSSELTVMETLPSHSLMETNSLGINELLAVGTSSFKGSPKNRRHNIEVGVEKFTGLIISPGANFSFNQYLGPVDGEHGFLPELVIKKEGTVPEFGGGLCQVSSTTFRAAMQAGLPILQRKNHAYAVQYYAPQGTDATIYPGVVDLKFTNDTPGAILIWPYFKDKDTLVFEFYGTKDSRMVTLEKPVQFDKKPDGSLKASWTRIVAKNGQEKTETFKSVYQSPALFHKEETFVTASSTVAAAQIPNPTQ